MRRAGETGRAKVHWHTYRQRLAGAVLEKQSTCKCLKSNDLVAGSTRLELATSGVTGRRSNQLSYDPAKGLTFRNGAPVTFALFRIAALPQCPIRQFSNGGRYRIRTCGSRRVKPVLYH